MWTLEKYEEYKQSVEHNLAHLTFVSTGACAGCDECGLTTGSSDYERAALDEGCFSWSPCEGCGSSLGGNRYPAHGRDANDEIVHFSICVDCLYFLNYGQLDDTSMAEMETR